MSETTQPILVRSKQVFECPECHDHDFGIDHLLDVPADQGRSFGPWVCDNCLWSFRGTIHSDGTVTVSKVTQEGRWRRARIVLEVEPTSEPIRFILNTTVPPRDSHQNDVEDFESSAYYYNEHTCPSNWLRNVEDVHVGKDEDPHGFATLVSIDYEGPDECESSS